MIAFRFRFYACLIWLVDGLVHGNYATAVASGLFLTALIMDFYKESK